MRNRLPRFVIPILALLAVLPRTQASENPFVGGWALTLPHNAAGWLGVEETNGRLRASIMWVAGSVEPTDSATIENQQLVLTRQHTSERKDANGNMIKSTRTERIVGTVDGDMIKLTSRTPRENGTGEEKIDFQGKRIPPMPPAPDLSKIKFGKQLELFNGKDLTGWRLTDPHAVNGWTVKDGVLINTVVHEEGKPHKSYGNLRTEKDFEDFNIKLEVRFAENGNSGVYLRGIYEVQVADTYGKPLDSHNMGGVYSRITPTASVEKPAGQWQTMDITLVDRHVTVVLNGTRIIDNQPVLGPTGGALWSDVTKPGPIYLQGDHASVEYRNIVLKPVSR
jgi:hypothetical protein